MLLQKCKVNVSVGFAIMLFKLIALVVIINFHSTWLADCAGCHSLDGLWYNELGSEMILNHTEDGMVIGEYRTAVERQAGSAGSTHSNVIGAAPYNTPGAVFGLGVLWGNGASVTSWTGQCLLCGDEERLETSWLLRQRVDTCQDKWQSTMIGQNTFTRYEQADGPRKADNTHGPGQQRDRTNSKRRRSVYSFDNRSRRPCSLTGYWYNALGSEMYVTGHNDFSVVGEYRTAVERSSGAAGRSHSMVYGIGNSEDPDSAVALYVVWNEGQSITSWVGQCHLCGDNQTEVLLTTWLLRSKISSCDDNWKSTLYGETSFTRQEQAPGPRRRLGVHSPGQLGEYADPSIRSSSSTTRYSAFTLITGVLAVMFNLS